MLGRHMEGVIDSLMILVLITIVSSSLLLPLYRTALCCNVFRLSRIAMSIFIIFYSILFRHVLLYSVSILPMGFCS